MFRSYTVGRLSGIDFKVHGSLLILLAFFVLSSLITAGLGGAMEVVALASIVVTSVTLHELGHIFAARAFGIGTTGLTLYPFGGIARLTREARSGLEEIVVAAAGPAVNVVLGGLAAIAFVFLGETVIGPLALTALYVNLAMGLFNLVPAYPMDGGRIFRGVLWPYLGKVKATDWAARGGQFFAVLGGLIAIATGQLILLVIAIFIYFQATAERQRVRFLQPTAHPFMRPDPEPPIRGQTQATRFYEDDRDPRPPAEPGFFNKAPAQAPRARSTPRSVLVRTPWGIMRIWES